MKDGNCKGKKDCTGKLISETEKQMRDLRIKFENMVKNIQSKVAGLKQNNRKFLYLA